MGTTRFVFSGALVSAAVATCVLVAVSLLLTACPGNNPPPVSTPQPGAKPNAAKPPSSGAPKAADPKAKPTTGAPTPAGEEGQAEEPIGPKVEVTDLLVDSPGVDFAGPGRYNITASTLLSEPWKPGVWDVIAYGEDGKKVGKQSLLLSMSHAKPKTLIFNDFYCSSIPVKVEILWTEKKADRSGEAEAGADESGKTKPGGGGPAGPSTGGGAKPPAKAPGDGGAKPPPPPTGGGDEGDGGGDLGE